GFTEQLRLRRQRAATVTATHLLLKIRNASRCQERISAVEHLVSEIEERLPAEFVGAGLREDLDPSEPHAVVLGRERVRVDANLADRFLWRKLAPAESVDVNLAAVRPAAGPASACRSAARSSGSSDNIRRSSCFRTM